VRGPSDRRHGERITATSSRRHGLPLIAERLRTVDCTTGAWQPSLHIDAQHRVVSRLGLYKALTALLLARTRQVAGFVVGSSRRLSPTGSGKVLGLVGMVRVLTGHLLLQSVDVTSGSSCGFRGGPSGRSELDSGWAMGCSMAIAFGWGGTELRRAGQAPPRAAA